MSNNLILLKSKTRNFFAVIFPSHEDFCTILYFSMLKPMKGSSLLKQTWEFFQSFLKKYNGRHIATQEIIIHNISFRSHYILQLRLHFHIKMVKGGILFFLILLLQAFVCNVLVINSEAMYIYTWIRIPLPKPISELDNNSSSKCFHKCTINNYTGRSESSTLDRCHSAVYYVCWAFPCSHLWLHTARWFCQSLGGK